MERAEVTGKIGPRQLLGGWLTALLRLARSKDDLVAAYLAARDQPNSRVSGSTKTDNVATAGPWRAKPAQHRHPRMTQP